MYYICFSLKQKFFLIKFFLKKKKKKKKKKNKKFCSEQIKRDVLNKQILSVQNSV